MKFSRATTLLLAFGLLIMALLVYAFFVKNAYQKIAQLRGTILLTEQELNRKQNAIDQAKELFQQYQGVSEVRALVARSLPLEPETPRATAQILELANRNALAIESIAYENPKINPGARGDFAFGYGQIRLKLDMVGTYENFKSFVKDVEASLRLFDIEKIDLSARDEKLLAQQQMLKYQVEISLYYQSKEKPQVRAARFQQPAGR